MTAPRHAPVMCAEVLDALAVAGERPVRIVDGTLGYGGHSSLILRRNAQAELLGIDRDDEAILGAKEVLSFASGRIHLVKGDFSGLAEHAARIGWHQVDAILLDLGVSSPQIDEAGRGFSHRLDGPLDMRMDGVSGKTACAILNTASQEELERIFGQYGEIRGSRILARAVVARRKERPWGGTGELARLCEAVLPSQRRTAPPSPTLCFQALRIAVNDELGELERALPTAVELLAPRGRLVVISYHSLEDRIVKRFIRHEASECLCPPGLPICMCGHRPAVRDLTRKPIRPTEAEIRDNRRAASAKLRTAEKI